MASKDYFIRETYSNREDWLAGRDRIFGSTGASSASVIAGISTFQTIDEYYDIRRGVKEAEDLSGNPRVAYGIAAEDPIRQLVRLDLEDQYNVDHHPFDILRWEIEPGIFATLDGELTRLSDGAKGVLEIKTGLLTKHSQDQWSAGHIPVYYLAQVCQQLLVTGWSYAILAYRLLSPAKEGEMPTVVSGYRYIQRSSENIQESIAYIKDSALEFIDCVRAGIRPSTRLRWKGQE